MRGIACVVACVTALLAAAPGATAATTNGQLVTIDTASAPEALVTLNWEGLPGEHRIYTATGRLDAPQWSPDGNRILFADGRRILVYTAATGALSEVARDGTAPTWSPDGARVLFARGAQLVTRLRDGGGEVVLPIDGTGVTDAAWSPDGEWLALRVGESLDLATLDGEFRDTIVDGVQGGAAWSPDSETLVYPLREQPGAATRLAGLSLETGDETAFSSGWDPADADRDPEWDPAGTGKLMFTRYTGTTTAIWVGDRSGTSSHSLPPGLRLSQPDWQPCLEGVTVACRSATPRVGVPSLNLVSCLPSTVVAVTGLPLALRPCPQATGLIVVEAPVHGTLVTDAAGRLVYTSAAGYLGNDTFTYRATRAGGQVSAVTRVSIVVRAKYVAPAAPKLTVIGTPRMDKRGRVTLKGTCDRACTVAVRLSTKLRGGRLVRGREKIVSAPAGGTVTLRLARGRIPARKRIVRVRVIGSVIGADQRARNVNVTVRR